MFWITLLSTIALGWSTSIPLMEDSKELDEPCMEPCYCEEKESFLQIHCESKGFTNISQITESWMRPFKLYLQRNSMRKLYSNGFLFLTNAVSINLGNNALQDIQAGAFNGMKLLKRLYLHENKLEVFRNDTFLGLESLEYLQADYNVLKRIDGGAFRNLNRLKVLIINDNLIPLLPHNLFRAVSLTHIDLRGNRLKSLSYAGTLEYIGRRLMEIQLEENPWNCTCEIMPLKSWLESIPYTVLVGEITCETPFHLHGKDLREIRRSELCPIHSSVEVEVSLGIPQLASSNDNAWPTKPSSMSLSVTYTASSVEYKTSGKLPKATKTPNTLKAQPTLRSVYSGQNQPIVAGYQTRPPIPIICPTECSCSLHINDLGLTVQCKNKAIQNMSELIPRPLNAKKLYLTDNLIQKIYRSDFWNFSSLDLLHLGSNSVSYIQDGAFMNLPNLKTLYLNNNEIERLTPGMFRGLQSLEYLYFEYNIIREIQPASFSLMPNLKLLFLNSNLLRTLPTDAFTGTSLGRLNLRNNYFLYLPVSGVLEHLDSIVQIDLNQNPWDCSCDLIALKQWVEKISTVKLIGSVLCETPEFLRGVDLKMVDYEVLCPELKHAAASPAVPGSGGNGNVISTTTGFGFSSQGGAIPLSVLILSLLIIFISAVFIAAGLFAFVLRRRKKSPFRRRQDVDLTGMQMQCRIFEERAANSPEKAASHVYDYIPHPVTQMCNNPIYKPREGEMEEEFSETQENNTNYKTLEKDKEWKTSLSNSNLNTIVTINQTNDFASFPENGVIYPTVLDRDRAAHTVGFVDCLYGTVPKLKELHVHPPGMQYPDLQQDARFKETILFGSSGRGYPEQTQSEYLELRAKLQTKPDYLEVLEKTSYRF
ncbi:SLIT and NTRK-like protein 3 [Chiloscyllium plagiosum]|uniref:SLIT and NTRK-like protein 3 n=1 Tax=Chiloscyllium plagiosum TaxID=36176 RepID=UPI001CB8471A|nr:SLIT and NTRK-like protein 3 [Chiloscyllium plagiosum]XP_043558081.1 SLIT and NTRK-like protein 3 [Chiloscyllium plagiosum]XP_043558082.1 SLIT and NTRK-like protein 3 [Chiloscyllium plagiosum]